MLLWTIVCKQQPVVTSSTLQSVPAILLRDAAGTTPRCTVENENMTTFREVTGAPRYAVNLK